MNKDNNSPIETTNYTFQQTECFYGGGGNKVHYYTIDQFDFSKYRDYQMFTIKLEVDIEKKSSPKAHISFWSGDVDLVYWNDITLKNGWNRYDHTYSMASTQYIPVSMVKDNMLKIKFDGHGILNYKVGTFIVTLTFYK